MNCDIDRLKVNVKIFAIYLFHGHQDLLLVQPNIFVFHLPVSINTQTEHYDSETTIVKQISWMNCKNRTEFAITCKPFRFAMRAHLSSHRKAAIYFTANYKHFYCLFYANCLNFVILWISNTYGALLVMCGSDMGIDKCIYSHVQSLLEIKLSIP